MASPDRLKPIELGVSSSSPLRAPYCLYEIDAEDRIVRCDEGWDAAAAEYGAPENASDHVRGRVLWSIFSDPATESIHRKAVSSLREHGVTSTIAYRCDLPAEPRIDRKSVV